MADDTDAAELAGEVGAALVSLLAPVPGVGILTKRFAHALAAEHQRRASVSLRRAEQLTGLTREQLQDAIADTPAAIPLTVRLLFAAGMNGHDRILQMMGRTLAEGLAAAQTGNERGLRTQELILAAIESLTPDHIDLLRRLDESPADPDVDNWTLPAIAGLPGVDNTALDLLLAGLINAGLLATHSGYGALIYETTDSADLVLHAADEVSEP